MDCNPKKAVQVQYQKKGKQKNHKKMHPKRLKYVLIYMIVAYYGG